MLPRLRFVFAAALIAALPWILLGTGIVTTAQNTPVSEYTRAGTAVALSAGDLRDSHHMHALAYVRRSRELERLRELGSEPLSEWVAAPAGIASSEPAMVPNDTPPQEAAPAAALIPQLPPETAPEPTVVASLPPEPATSVEGPAVAMPATAAPEIAVAPPIAPTSSGEQESHVDGDVAPNLSHVDWSTVVPPLPRARGDDEHRKSANRRLRVKRAYFASRARASQVQPNPFGGPPATATTFNPARNNPVPH